MQKIHHQGTIMASDFRKFSMMGFMIGLISYVGLYFIATEVFRGRMDGTVYRIRLFHSPCHQRFFQPVLSLEALIRSSEAEFSGQVRDGASLPPAE